MSDQDHRQSSLRQIPLMGNMVLVSELEGLLRIFFGFLFKWKLRINVEKITTVVRRESSTNKMEVEMNG